MDADVLICGLGPVGQLLALQLGGLGVATIAFDEGPGVYDLPRAASIDDEVLRIFQSVGLDAAVLRDAQVQDQVSFVTGPGEKIKILDSEVGDLGQPPLVSIHQPSMERTMVAALEERRSAELRWGRRLESIEALPDGAKARIVGVDGGPPEELSARFLIGCDGARSSVRRLLGVDFGGSTFVQRWLVVDVLVERPIAAVPHTNFIGDPRRPAVSLPMSPGRHRWEWMLHPGEPAEPLLDRGRIKALMDPWLDGEPVEIERALVYTFHARVASTWRVGDVLLAGDAAHVMPPFIGQGFSSGARDSANLAWKLDAVLRGAPVALLDSYEAERRPHVRSMQSLAVRFGGLLQTTRGRAARVRDRTLRAADAIGLLGVVRDHAKPLPAYGAGAFARRPQRLPFRRDVGSLFPQPDRLDDRLGRGWAVVAGSATAADRWRGAGLHAVELGDDPWLRRHGADWAVLRPDRYVFACGGSGEEGTALARLEAVAGPSPLGRGRGSPSVPN